MTIEFSREIFRGGGFHLGGTFHGGNFSLGEIFSMEGYFPGIIRKTIKLNKKCFLSIESDGQH